MFSLILLFAASTALASPTASTSEACKQIQQALPGKLAFPNEKAYTKENNDYYNIGLAELKPACIVHPTSAEEVSRVVKLLNQNPGVPFAVKSGGHDPNAGHSSVKDGILVALSQLKGVTLNKQKQLAEVLPGGHWIDIIGPLDKQGFTVVGGRLGQVGIGGYMMQGGLSYLSAHYGMACDSIVEYETVLANGTIARINMENNKDLMVAMRGAGSQFGITTKFITRAYPMGKIWGGIRLYTSGNRDALFAALNDFVGNYPDPKAAVIYTASRSLGFDFYPIFFFYDGPNPPARVFEKFNAIKPAFDMTKVQSYTDMLGGGAFGIGSSDSPATSKPSGTKASGMGSLFGGLGKSKSASAVKGSAPPKSTASSGTGGLFGGLSSFGGSLTSELSDYISGQLGPVGTRTSFRSITLPHIPSNPKWLSQIEDTYHNITADYLKDHKTTITTIAFQPLPNLVGKATEERGGNAMGLRASDHNRFILEITSLWQNKADDDILPGLAKKLTDELEKQVAAMKANAKTTGAAVGDYNPFFMNDAFLDQDVMSSYRDVVKFKQLQKENDPQGLWTRAGGFKYS